MLDAHTHFELVKSNSNFVFYQTNINQSEFTYWKVEICKKKTKGNEYMKLWHLCLTPTHLWYMSQFLLQKKLCFETGTHPPFGPMSQNTQFFFFEGFPKAMYYIQWLLPDGCFIKAYPVGAWRMKPHTAQ